MSEIRKQVKILQNDTASNEINVAGFSFFTLHTSAALTGVTFGIHQERADGVFDETVNDTGTAIEITVAPNKNIALVSEEVAKAMAAASKIQFVSNTAELGGDRVMFLTME